MPVVKQENFARNTMPDVRSMTLKDALYLLENMDMKVLTKGREEVGSDIPDTAISKNQTVTILLN